MDILVTYDINTTTAEGIRRLARVADVCGSYGTRTQYSVFECRVSEVNLRRLIINLADEIDPGVDSVNIYRFEGGLTASRLSLGRSPWREPGDPWVI
jgi:CRISPR-associated protein Cas2